MGGLSTYRARLERTLREHAAAYAVPGAVVGVLLDDETEIACWGVANAATGVETTPDTLFQVGSLAKLYTATLLAQGSGAGVISLDEPVRAQLQEFEVADPGATLEITPRHLLAHTSGIQGDHLIDTGSNPDALERYVATLAHVSQVHAPDQTYSFCNTGFGVIGRLMEVAVGQHFDRVLRRRLLRPLGAKATVTLPQHALMHRVAVGHEDPHHEGQYRPVSRWPLTRSNGPMGGILAPAEEVLAFARVHIAGGVAANGTELLPASAVEALTESHIASPLPDETQALAWTERRWGDLPCLAQDGDTFGQRAFLRVIPARGFAACLFTNSPSGARLAHDMWPVLAGDLLDLEVPITTLRKPPGDLPDPSPYVGSYERLHQRLDVATTPVGGLEMTVTPSGVLRDLGREKATVPLVAIDAAAGVFRATMPDTGQDEAVVFTPLTEDTAPGAYLQGRLHLRLHS